MVCGKSIVEKGGGWGEIWPVEAVRAASSNFNPSLPPSAFSLSSRLAPLGTLGFCPGGCRGEGLRIHPSPKSCHCSPNRSSLLSVFVSSSNQIFPGPPRERPQQLWPSPLAAPPWAGKTGPMPAFPDLVPRTKVAPARVSAGLTVQPGTQRPADAYLLASLSLKLLLIIIIKLFPIRFPPS